MKHKKNLFFLIGCAGYIAKRHVEAIHKLKNSELISVFDPSSNVGYLDSFSFKINYFSNFDDFVNNLNNFNKSISNKYLVICSPNNTHVNYIKFGLKNNFKIICEKPICIKKKEYEYLLSLNELEKNNVYSLLQLRYSKSIYKIKKYFSSIIKINKSRKIIKLKYVTPRGKWYFNTWKGDPKRSGGILLNIGIHLFDFLIFIFGEPMNYKMTSYRSNKSSGYLIFNGFKVMWYLSLDINDIKKNNNKSIRALYTDQKFFELSENFEDLHLSSYKSILSSKKSNLLDSLKSINLVINILNKYKNDT